LENALGSYGNQIRLDGQRMSRHSRMEAVRRTYNHSTDKTTVATIVDKPPRMTQLEKVPATVDNLSLDRSGGRGDCGSAL